VIYPAYGNSSGCRGCIIREFGSKGRIQQNTSHRWTRLSLTTHACPGPRLCRRSGWWKEVCPRAWYPRREPVVSLCSMVLIRDTGEGDDNIFVVKLLEAKSRVTSPLHRCLSNLLNSKELEICALVEGGYHPPVTPARAATGLSLPRNICFLTLTLA
jgi:hypothetical protein